MKLKKENILFLEYFPFLGGGQKITLKIAEYLKQFFNVQFICFNDGLIINELKKMRIEYKIINAPRHAKLRYFWSFIPFYFRFKRYLVENNIKLIYCNSYFTAKLATFVSKETNIPVIWHKHIIIENSKDSYLAGQIRKISKYVNKIICVSNAVKKSMIGVGVEEDKLCVIYNGIDTRKKTNIKNIIINKYKLDNCFIAGSVGFFRRNKGFELLIKAAAIIKQKQNKIKFFITGKSDGDYKYEQELKLLTKKNNIEDTVIFGGYIDWFKCIEAFDVLIIPSYAEPFGLVTVEAGLYEVPVIAFATGGTPEIIKNGINGFLVKNVSAEDLASKVIYVYNKRKKLRKIGLRAKKIVMEKFNEKKMRESILNIVKEILNEKK